MRSGSLAFAWIVLVGCSESSLERKVVVRAVPHTITPSVPEVQAPSASPPIVYPKSIKPADVKAAPGPTKPAIPPSTALPSTPPKQALQTTPHANSKAQTKAPKRTQRAKPSSEPLPPPASIEPAPEGLPPPAIVADPVPPLRPNQQQIAPVQVEQDTFVSKAGHFRIQLPGPARIRQEATAPFAQVPRLVVEAKDEQQIVRIGVIRIKGQPVERLIANERAHLLHTLDGRELDNRLIDRRNWLGMQSEIVTRDGVTHTIRWIPSLVHHRLYTLQIAGRDRAALDPTIIKAFFESFQPQP